MNIPPLLSRTPPPLCDSESNENEDSDFGNFAMCSSDIGRDVYDEYRNVGKTVCVEDSASEDSGLCTGSSMGQAHSPYETSPTICPKGLPNGQDNLFEPLQLPDTSQEHMHLPHHSMCDVIGLNELDVESQIEVEEIESIEEAALELKVNDVPEDSLNLHSLAETSALQTKIAVASTSSTSNQDFLNKVDDYIDDHDGDFEEFQVFEGTINISLNAEVNTTPTYGYMYDHENSSLGNVSSENINNVNENWDQSNFECKEREDDLDDEFSDFQVSSFSPTLVAQPEMQPSLLPQFHSDHFLQMERDVTGKSDVDDPNVNMTSEIIPTLEVMVFQGQVWPNLHCLEDTPALRYQWASSSSNRKFLTALKIDSRNILCSLWNKSIKTGGSEGASLDLLKIGSESKNLAKNQFLGISKNTVPDAHFDWVGSGLTNPLDCGSTTLLDMPHLSFTCASKSIPAESPFASSYIDESCVSSMSDHVLGSNKISQQAEEILSSLPDRSYLKKTYIVFKKFS